VVRKGIKMDASRWWSSLGSPSRVVPGVEKSEPPGLDSSRKLRAHCNHTWDVESCWPQNE